MKFPKPETIARTKARKARTEAAVIKKVREACVLRDGACRIGKAFGVVHGVCAGPSQWAHLPPMIRSRTRNLPPEERHSTKWTLMLCLAHHRQVDFRRKPWLVITPTTPAGADGPLEVRVT